MQTVFCDKHTLQKMYRVEFSKEGKVEADGFKCGQCNRVYILAGRLGVSRFCELAVLGRQVADCILSCILPARNFGTMRQHREIET
jgi:hypothetical protein